MPTPIDPDLPTQGPEAPCCLVIFGEGGDGPLLLAAAMAVPEVLAAFGQGGIGAADGLVLRFAPTDAEIDVCLRLCAEAGMSQPRVLTGEAAAILQAVHAVETLVPTSCTPAGLGQRPRSLAHRVRLERGAGANSRGGGGLEQAWRSASGQASAFLNGRDERSEGCSG